jgi:hypothetical protein
MLFCGRSKPRQAPAALGRGVHGQIAFPLPQLDPFMLGLTSIGGIRLPMAGATKLETTPICRGLRHIPTYRDPDVPRRHHVKSRIPQSSRSGCRVVLSL